jgi:hypothetical protein
MLKLRKEQGEALEEDMRRRIRQSAMNRVRQERPDDFRKLGESRLSELIRLAESRIDGFDGDLFMDLQRYLYLMLEFGSGFSEEKDWAIDVLHDSDIPGSGKVDVLEVYAMQQRQRDALNPIESAAGN